MAPAKLGGHDNQVAICPQSGQGIDFDKVRPTVAIDTKINPGEIPAAEGALRAAEEMGPEAAAQVAEVLPEEVFTEHTDGEVYPLKKGNLGDKTGEIPQER